MFIALLAIGLPAIGIPLAALYAGGAGMVIWASREQGSSSCSSRRPGNSRRASQQPTYPQDRA